MWGEIRSWDLEQLILSSLCLWRRRISRKQKERPHNATRAGRAQRRAPEHNLRALRSEEGSSVKSGSRTFRGVWPKSSEPTLWKHVKALEDVSCLEMLFINASLKKNKSKSAKAPIYDSVLLYRLYAHGLPTCTLCTRAWNSPALHTKLILGSALTRMENICS